MAFDGLVLVCGRESEQLEELLSAKTGLLQDHEEGAALERSAVERDGDDARVVGAPAVAVRAGGVVKEKACALRARMTAVGVQAGRRVMRQRGSPGPAR